MISVIVAGIIDSENGDKLGIGFAGTIPWKIPEDMKYFKDTTADSCVIMGRKTWESIPEKFRPLPGRFNIILSTTSTKLDENTDTSGKNPKFCQSLGEALNFISESTLKYKKIFIIGGASLYQEVISDHKDKISEFHITIITPNEQTPKLFDTYFPLNNYIDLGYSDTFTHEKKEVICKSGIQICIYKFIRKT